MSNHLSKYKGHNERDINETVNQKGEDDIKRKVTDSRARLQKTCYRSWGKSERRESIH